MVNRKLTGQAVLSLCLDTNQQRMTLFVLIYSFLHINDQLYEYKLLRNAYRIYTH